MDANRPRQAAKWYYSTIFHDESIVPPANKSETPLPSLLRTARSLAQGENMGWQSRESIFVKQAKLLVNYEDDCPYEKEIVRYFPTYQSFTDLELRGYFTWRTLLRKGDVRRTSLSFAFLYIYELLNQIGVSDPMDGYRRLVNFQQIYGQIDEKILSYLKQWLTDYVIYYNLSPDLLQETQQARFDRSVSVLEQIHTYEPDDVVSAVKVLSPKWLERSKFYAAHADDFDRVLVRTLGRIWDHYDTRCIKSMAEQFFGTVNRYPLMLFNSAVFLDQQKVRDRDYVVDDNWRYQCRGGLWSVAKRTCPAVPSPKLVNLLKTIDRLMRQEYDFGHPLQSKPEPKWVTSIIQEEIHTVVEKNKAREKAKISIDYSKLTKIRREAAVTQEKLMVEDEEEWGVPASHASLSAPDSVQDQPEVTESDFLLSPVENRLLKNLLYGEDISWVTAEGQMMSVLIDSINEKLYDQFQDSVLLMDTIPELVEDYIDDLKEMVAP